MKFWIRFTLLLPCLTACGVYGPPQPPLSTADQPEQRPAVPSARAASSSSSSSAAAKGNP